MNEKQKETLMTYASVLKIPNEICLPVISDFIRMNECNGSEFVCSRFKAAKLDFIRLKAGKEPVSQWIGKKSPIHFSGSLGGLQTWSSKNWKNWSKAIQLLQVYSTEIASEVLPSQAKKFVDAVTYKNPNPDSFPEYGEMLIKGIKIVYPDKVGYPNPQPLLFYPVSSTRREPHASGKSYPEGEQTLECAMSYLDQTVTGRLSHILYPNLFGPLLLGITQSGQYQREKTRSGIPRYVIERKTYTDNVGKIGLIQEPGLKLRAVANPARVYQAALKPLGDVLYNRLATLPWDCTHNQTLPYNSIHQHLAQGKVAHAIDLSNATDRFPIQLQEKLLFSMFHRIDGIKLFLDLSKSTWLTSLTEHGNISWKTGQPLGLYPSFATFAMTHGFMLYALNNYAHDGLFYVLGDDVVILDDILHQKYMKFLSDMDIPFSPQKSISSDILTEFAGKIITKDEVIPQLKWRHVSDDSFLDLAKHFGHGFRALMKPRQRRIFDIVKGIPEELGGCGFNPEGIKLDTRIDLYLSLESEDNKRSFMMSYNGRLQSMNYSVGNLDSKNNWYYQMSPTSAFDQKAAQFATKVSPSFKKYIPIDLNPLWTKVVGNPLYVVYPRERCVPILGSSVRSSTLDVLERKLL